MQHSALAAAARATSAGLARVRSAGSGPRHCPQLLGVGRPREVPSLGGSTLSLASGLPRCSSAGRSPALHPAEDVSDLWAPSAYVHIPFCRRRCYYCDFPISVVGNNSTSAFVSGAPQRKSPAAPLLPQLHFGCPLVVRVSLLHRRPSCGLMIDRGPHSSRLCCMQMASQPTCPLSARRSSWPRQPAARTKTRRGRRPSPSRRCSSAEEHRPCCRRNSSRGSSPPCAARLASPMEQRFPSRWIRVRHRTRYATGAGGLCPQPVPCVLRGCQLIARSLARPPSKALSIAPSLTPSSSSVSRASIWGSRRSRRRPWKARESNCTAALCSEPARPRPPCLRYGNLQSALLDPSASRELSRPSSLASAPAAGRAHSVDDGEKAIKLVSSSGVRTWGLDLISGLPHQARRSPQSRKTKSRRRSACVFILL